MFRRAVLGAVLALVTIFALPAAAQTADAGASCSGKAAVESGSTGQMLDSGGLTRVYRIYVPESYDPTRPTPLVMSLHGVVSSADEQEEKTGWNAVADAEGFLMVYPQGILPAAFGWAWKAGEPLADELRREVKNASGETVEVDDVAFIADLIAHLSGEFCVDPARIFVTGFSNGGGMTNHIACELADTVAAIGTNAGAYTPIPGGCNPSRPVPVVTFQGKRDRIVPYEGSPRLGMEGVESWAAGWAARNGCDPDPANVELSLATVSAVMYGGCTDDASVEVYTVADGGHTWPGGTWNLPFVLGPTNTDISASAAMWDFFAAHPMP